MARTWRNERSTPKKHGQQGPKRPRMSEFAREYYQGQGYTTEVYCDAPMDSTADGYRKADA